MLRTIRWQKTCWQRCCQDSLRYGLAALALGATLTWQANAEASTIYGTTLSADYIKEAPEPVPAMTACLYCHPTIEGKIVTKSFGKVLQQQYGLEQGNVDLLNDIMTNDVMKPLDDVIAAGGDPLADKTLLDSDIDSVPDALEVRWGSNPSDPNSKLEPDKDNPGKYTVHATVFPPVMYGCGARIAPGALSGRATPVLALPLALGLVWWRARRRRSA